MRRPSRRAVQRSTKLPGPHISATTPPPSQWSSCTLLSAGTDQQALKLERLARSARQFDIVDDAAIFAFHVEHRKVEELADELDRAVWIHPFPPEVRMKSGKAARAATVITAK